MANVKMLTAQDAIGRFLLSLGISHVTKCKITIEADFEDAAIPRVGIECERLLVDAPLLNGDLQRIAETFKLEPM